MEEEALETIRFEIVKEVNVSVPPYFDDKVAYVEVKDWLLMHLLSRRYMRLESLIKTKPKNALEKLVLCCRTTVKIDLSEFETTLYKWLSNTKESEMFVFADPMGDRVFALLPDKKLLVSLPLRFVCSYYP